MDPTDDDVVVEAWNTVLPAIRIGDGPSSTWLITARNRT